MGSRVYQWASRQAARGVAVMIGITPLHIGCRQSVANYVDEKPCPLMDAASRQPRHVNGWLIGKQGAHRRAVRPLTKWASARQTGSEVDPPAPPVRYSPYPHATSPISQGRKPSCIANPICPRRSAPSACAPSVGGASGRAAGRRFATAASAVATLVTAASNL